MKISTDKTNQITRLAFAGSLSYGEMEETEERVCRMIDDTERGVLVDLSEVEYMDSNGISLLVKMQQVVRDSGREMVLVSLRPSIEKMFHASNLTRIFKVAGNEQEALALLHPREVLLFDDREDIVYFYKEVVEANYFRCRHTFDLDEALGCLRGGEVKLVLIDALDEDQPKYELVRQMKQDDQLKDIPILVLSINEDEEFQYSQFGVDRFILKPFKIDRFVTTLRQLLTEKQEG